MDRFEIRMRVIMIVMKVKMNQHQLIHISNYQIIFEKLMGRVVGLENKSHNLHYSIYYSLIFEYFFDQIHVSCEVSELVARQVSYLIDHPRILNLI
jgi:hypothetical protein